MDIQQRLEVFFRRLADAPPATNADEALRLVCRLIEEVEGELCPVPRRTPPPKEFTGRMYAPQADRIRRLPQGIIIADTRRHRIYCQLDGAISVERIDGRRMELIKPGARR